VKRFSEMNPRIVGVSGIMTVVLLMVTTLSIGKLTEVLGGEAYRAAFSHSTGLKAGNPVRVSGLDVGTVRSVELDGNRVIVMFTAEDVTLGSQTSAAIKTETALGGRFLQLTPRGDGDLSEEGIPLTRTQPAYPLTDAVQDTTRTAERIDTAQLAASFDVLADTLADTPADLRAALDGVRRLSGVIAERDEALAALLDHANGVSGLLAQRSTQITTILTDGNALLAELEARRDIIDTLMANITAVTKQISGLTRDNRATLRPALSELRKTLAVL
jgi:phospholipid/cholesterol/gamma-HCH transport system substrate-binding protein